MWGLIETENRVVNPPPNQKRHALRTAERNVQVCAREEQRRNDDDRHRSDRSKGQDSRGNVMSRASRERERLAGRANYLSPSPLNLAMGEPQRCFYNAMCAVWQHPDRLV